MDKNTNNYSFVESIVDAANSKKVRIMVWLAIAFVSGMSIIGLGVLVYVLNK